MTERAAFSNTIWRTVVFAGAMLATPLVADCGGSDKKPATMPEPQPTADKAAADPAATDLAAKEAEEKALADAAAAKPRPRASTSSEAMGRGFI